MSRFITTPTGRWLEGKLAHCASRLLIASPYVGPFLASLAGRLRSGVSTTLLTRTDLRDFALGSSDIEALCDFARRGATVMGLAGLHAKVYVLDNKAALVTSANATYSGMSRNWECGVAIDDPVEVRAADAEFVHRDAGTHCPVHAHRLAQQPLVGGRILEDLDADALGQHAVVADQMVEVARRSGLCNEIDRWIAHGSEECSIGP